MSETRIIDKFGFQAVLTLTTAVRMSVAGRKARRTDTAFARDLRARASMPVHGTMDSRFIFFPLSSYYYLNFLELQLFGKDIKISQEKKGKFSKSLICEKRFIQSSFSTNNKLEFFSWKTIFIVGVRRLHVAIRKHIPRPVAEWKETRTRHRAEGEMVIQVSWNLFELEKQRQKLQFQGRMDAGLQGSLRHATVDQFASKIPRHLVGWIS